MGTTPSALNLTSASTATFNGSSQYAGDLQQAINHAVAIASIPLTELENNVTTLESRSSEVNTLQSDFTNIQTALQQLASAGGSGSLTGTVGDATIASVNVDQSANPTAGAYDLNVISPGSAASAISNDGLPTVSDPNQNSISTSGSYTLTVGTSTYTVSPSENTLSSLAEAINSGNYGVTATIINIGPPSAPDYRLSLQSTSLGDENIQLNDGSQDLLSVLTTGSPAQYQIDGQPSTPISSDNSTVTIAPGVTVGLLQAGETTVTVAPNSSAASDALSAFVSAYNSTLAELSSNRGLADGPLSGQNVVLQLQQTLSDLTQYSGGSGSVQSFADLGLTFNSQGQLSFNQATFESVTATNSKDVTSFLGSTTGGGFLGNATNLLNSLTDISTGTFTQAQSSYRQQLLSDSSQITDTEARITTLQNNLTQQMTQADTLIASLESQVTYFTTLFNDTQTTLTKG